MRHPCAGAALRALRVHDHRAWVGSGREDVLLRSLCGRSGRERLGGSRVSDSIKEEPKTSRRKICVPILSEEEKTCVPIYFRKKKTRVPIYSSFIPAGGKR